MNKEFSKPYLRLLVAMTLFCIHTPMAKAQDGLEVFGWKNRLVLIHGSGNHPHTRDQLEQLLQQKEGLADRDLVVILLDSQSEEVQIKFGADQIPLDYKAIVSKRKIDPHYFQVLLIGKDGGTKLKKGKTVPLETIFSLIDRMPMRQAEMKEKE